MSNQHSSRRPVCWDPEMDCFKIELTQGYSALVDPRDIGRAARFNWSASKTRWTVYGIRREGDGKSIYLHRFILGEDFELPGEIQVDHANGDGLDCRRVNLRLCTSKQNAQNRAGLLRETTSKFKGVMRRGDRWIAQCRGERLGTFDDEIAAAAAYDRTAREQYGGFACLNFPKDGERGADGTPVGNRTPITGLEGPCSIH